MFLRFYLLTFFLFFTLSSLHAQDKYDYTWITGYYGGNDPAAFFGGNNIDFSAGNPDVSFLYLPLNARLTPPCSMSDANGIFQFYSGGCRIYNNENQVIENGEDINEGDYSNEVCPGNSDGYLNHNGLTSLPAPGHPGVYYLFHIRRLGSFPDDTEALYTLIDMNANNGLGKVVLKNQPLPLTDTLAFTINTVRHGNGRDWWVVLENLTKSVFYRFLLDKDGLHGPWTQEVEGGWVTGHQAIAECVFSPDGKKYVQHSDAKPATFVLYDFDRCSGLMSNPLQINLPGDTVIYPSWCCFSPSSRYLYLTNSFVHLYQFDLQADDVEASGQIVGEYDNFISIYGLPTSFYAMALGPDQRIYMTAANAVNVLHRIEYPDLPGAACTLKQHSVPLAAHMSFWLPNIPNFRLYDWEDSPCDTLSLEYPMEAQWREEQDSLSGPLAVQFTEYSWHHPVSWQWDFGDGTTDTTRSPLHFYPAPGMYNVCLIACNTDGLCDTLCRIITVVSKSVGVEQGGAALSVSVYPNPASDVIYVGHPGLENASFVLFDGTGREVVRYTLPSFSSVEKIDISRLPNGFYFGGIVDRDRRVYLMGKKIIKM